MKILKNQIVKGKHKPIYVDLFYKENNIQKPIVLFVHGYKGFKDWGCWDLIAKTFAENDVLFIKMNFSHNGTTAENTTEFADLEAFGHNNFSKEIDDLQTVIDWIYEEKSIQQNCNLDHIALIGHSRGGGTVTLMANEDKRITKLITWAGVSDFGARFPSGEILEEWKKRGVAYITNTRTNQQMPHYIQFYEDYVQHKERFSIKKASQNIQIPTLILHGTHDETVLLAEAENLHAWNKNSKLIVIENANHTFGGTHPWEKDHLPEYLNEVVKNSIVFVINL